MQKTQEELNESSDPVSILKVEEPKSDSEEIKEKDDESTDTKGGMKKISFDMS